MPALDNKVAWVTGAGTGIGEAAAIALANEGATVVLTGRRKEPLEMVAKRIGAKASVEAADLTDAKAVDGVVSRIVLSAAPMREQLSSTSQDAMRLCRNSASLSG